MRDPNLKRKTSIPMENRFKTAVYWGGFFLAIAFSPLLLQASYYLIINYLSPDHFILTKTKVTIAIIFYGLLLVIFLGYGLKAKLIPGFIKRFFHRIFLDPKILFIFSFSAGSALFILDIIRRQVDPDFETQFFGYLFRENGIFEVLTFVVLCVCFMLAWNSAFKLNKTTDKKVVNHIFTYLIILGLLFFFAAMEEISWGQRIFQWETPEKFFSKNLQNETNLHNFFNPFRPFIYGAVNFGLLVFMMIVSQEKLRVKLFPKSQIILPLPGLLGLAILLVFASLMEIVTGSSSDELIEDLGTLFSILYVVRIYLLVVQSTGVVENTGVVVSID